MLPRAESGRPGRPGIPMSAGGLAAQRDALPRVAVVRQCQLLEDGGPCGLAITVPRRRRSRSTVWSRRSRCSWGSPTGSFDWHIFPRLDEPVVTRLQAVGQLRGTLLFCEWMGVDRWEDEILGRQWWSSDMDRILSLRWPLPDARSGAETASEHWSLVEDDNQGGSAEIVADINNAAKRGNARIVGGRVYLQGAFVMDDPTDTDEHAHLEIHPLDSVAYALDGDGTVLAQRGTDTSWPRSTVVWRVGVVTNAGFHRINGCSFLEQDRTTVWYLDLPTLAGLPLMIAVRVDDSEPGFGTPPRTVGSAAAVCATSTCSRGRTGATVTSAPSRSIRQTVGENCASKSPWRGQTTGAGCSCATIASPPAAWSLPAPTNGCARGRRSTACPIWSTRAGQLMRATIRVWLQVSGPSGTISKVPSLMGFQRDVEGVIVVDFGDHLIAEQVDHRAAGDQCSDLTASVPTSLEKFRTVTWICWLSSAWTITSMAVLETRARRPGRRWRCRAAF